MPLVVTVRGRHDGDVATIRFVDVNVVGIEEQPFRALLTNAVQVTLVHHSTGELVGDECVDLVYEVTLPAHAELEAIARLTNLARERHTERRSRVSVGGRHGRRAPVVHRGAHALPSLTSVIGWAHGAVI